MSPRRFPLSVLLASAGAAFVAGFALAWHLQDSAVSAAGNRTAPVTQQGRVAASPFGQGGTAAGAAPDSSLSGAGAGAVAVAVAPTSVTPPLSDPMADEQKLREQAQTDPVVLRRLIQQYEAESDPAKRESLRAILGTVDKPEALALFARLAASSDVARRQEAYELLQNMPDSAQARAILRQALAGEQTPVALTQAITALKPAQVEPAEADAIIAQLRGLTQHADAGVRSQSILQLGQWDRTGAGQDQYVQALSDASPQVRQAAIFAIAQSGARGDSAKTGLLLLLNSATESRDVRGSAMQALERFSLNKDELASFNRARAQLGN